MLDYNQIKPRKYILVDDEPYEVITSQVSRKQANKPVNRTKLKHLLTGRVIEYTFHVSDKVDEAEMETREIKYLYSNRGESWFSDPEDPSDRFSIPTEDIEDDLRFILPNEIATAKLFNDKITGFKIPIKIELKVTEAPPNIKGNTSSGGSKTVVTETGLKVITPLFIEAGDIIRINTDTGEYVERVSKK